MCGDFEDQESIDEELFALFLERAGNFGISAQGNSQNVPTRLVDESVRKGYMDALFKAGLTRSMNDASALPRGERMDVLAGQAIVFARLAGFLAAQFPAQADLFRTIVGSMLDGHAESGSRC